ncbi:hypothetical protein HN51_067150 [Arachis hypogaea]|uniref:Knottin scorpion toxin-like domain-containing protein n=1 Tax=Arachis hypogaea TaxID=3818 RepID=A0A444ZM35_ARAHY|nr:hypothetical protein Ahy_B04g071973 isoform C [Arachis hypogaea]
MKAFTNVLIILLVFSIGIGNERLVKITEAASKRCTATLDSVVICVFTWRCIQACKSDYGRLASGSCIGGLCVCQYPPPCHNL